ncbi:ABC transporter permease, partial [Escherichia coli]
MISVYTLIFSELMLARLAGMDGPFAYSIYICSGVLTGGLFTETLGNLVNVVLTNATILKNLSCPRSCLPISVTASAF